MSLTSWSFIGFVLCTVLLYYIVPAKRKWLVLLAASSVFYISFSVPGLLILAGTALVTYFAALQIQKNHNAEAAWLAENKQIVSKEERKAKKKEFQRGRQGWVALVVCLSIGLLFLFKYYGPFAGALNNALGTRLWAAENLLLPLGISFYSLQLIGYVVDVSRGIIPAEKNPLKVILYGAFFLSIMQGPFNRYKQLMPQICNEERQKLTFYKFKLAVLKITWGYIKKMCIADQIGLIATEVFTNYNTHAGLGIVLGMICFAIQLYADFSGYMDIVSGIGELLDIELPANFRQPFFSRSISEFWQKWHISLGAWLKDYVFYPLLKSNAFQKMGKWLTPKVGKEAGRRIPTYIGMFILWTLIGAWHGAGFNYVFSVGILQFLYIFTGEMFELFKNRAGGGTSKPPKHPALRHVLQSLRCTVLMIFAWAFFNSPTFMDAVHMLGRLFADAPGLSQIQAIFQDSKIVAGSYKTWLIYLFMCTLVLFLHDLFQVRGLSVRKNIEKRIFVIRMFFYLALIFTLIIFGSYGDNSITSDFIYFRF